MIEREQFEAEAFVPWWAGNVRVMQRLRREAEEAALRKVVREWLPRPLRGLLLNNPRLLAFYVKLPHRRRPVIEYRGEEFRVVVVAVFEFAEVNG